MKNLIINTFKTLFFFDFILIVLHKLPTLKNANPALERLINEALVLAVLVVFTFVFLRFVEKRQLRLNTKKLKFKGFFVAGISGFVLPVVTVGLIRLLKGVDYIGLNKIPHFYYWIFALLFNVIATELLFRGYLFCLFKKHYGFLVSAIITTALYLAVNTEVFSAGKIYIANIVLLNILLCLAYEFSGSFVFNIIAKFTYYILSVFMLGSFTLSAEYPALVNTAFNGKPLYTGCEKGIENSIIMLCLTTAITLFLLHKKYDLIKKIKFAVNYTKNKFKSLKLKFKRDNVI